MKKKGLFMKSIIIYCLIFVAAVNLLGMFITYKTGFDTSAIATNITAFYGGELALCCLKRIFVDNDKKKKSKNENEDSEQDILNESQQNIEDDTTIG